MPGMLHSLAGESSERAQSDTTCWRISWNHSSDRARASPSKPQEAVIKTASEARIISDEVGGLLTDCAKMIAAS